MNKKDFLFEIGCEELPARYQNTLAKNIADSLKKELEDAKLTFGETHTYATPRRLAVMITDLVATQASQETLRQGPSYENAYGKDGTPTLACIGFAKSCNVSTDQLEVQDTPKGRRVVCRVKQEGKPSADLLPEIVSNALKKLHIPKPMRWGNNDFTFIRPVKWAVMLFGRDVVPANLFGKKTSRDTLGHRFHHPGKISITEPRDYHVILYSKVHVIADFDTRRNMIQKAIEKTAGDNNKSVIDPDLLEEVTALVEWPVALLGTFNEMFLQLPREVLITSMATHLKCFPVENAHGDLLPKFIIISNIDAEDPSLIIKGNEKVINARLSDADFFYKNDLKISLEKRIPSLGHVIFQKQLGSLEDKSHRLASLAASIATQIDCNVEIAKRAALLSKCDLVSEMVVEFPKLQGIMGYYYALNDGEEKACAVAIKEHYLPRFAGDALPKSLEGAAVALSDRLDTLIGILGINKLPTGDKDPFGLRRAALGILRIIIEKELPLDLMQMIRETYQSYEDKLPNKDVIEQAFDFMMGRLKAWYLEQGIAAEVFEAVFARRPTAIFDFHRRIEAVQQFNLLPEADALASANKRVSNILKKSDETIPPKPDSNLFEQQEEIILAELLEKHQKTTDALYKKADYTQALTALSGLKEPVDAFFDQVMIMDENLEIRKNRLALLASIRHLFTQVADISLLP